MLDLEMFYKVILRCVKSDWSWLGADYWFFYTKLFLCVGKVDDYVNCDMRQNVANEEVSPLRNKEAGINKNKRGRPEALSWLAVRNGGAALWAVGNTPMSI